MFKQEVIEPNLTVSKLNRWVQAEDEDDNLMFAEWIGVQGPERCGSALLIHVFVIFGMQSGIPSFIVQFLGLTARKPKDSWLLLDMRDAVYRERQQAFIFRELLMAQNGGWNTVGWNDSAWVTNMRLYQRGRAFCHRCGEKADLSSLCEFAVCKVCWHSGRRLNYKEDEAKRGLDARYGPLSFYLGSFTCIMVDERKMHTVRKVGLTGLHTPYGLEPLL
jgi:hypothetical protein